MVDLAQPHRKTGSKASNAIAHITDSDRSSIAGQVSLGLRTHKRAVYDTLRAMIVWFELPPGERLIESELAARLGVSKTPIREALAMLEADGLVEATPYRGAMVRWLTVLEMREQGFLVDALEVPAFPMVVDRITPSEMASIGRIVGQLKRARAAGDDRRFARLIVEMHTQLFQPIEFPRLRRLIDAVVAPVGLRYDRAIVYRFPDAWDLYLRLTVDRFEAIRDGDPARAGSLVRLHRRELLEICLARVSHPSVAPFFKGE